MERRREIMEMRETGLTYAEIGRKYGISKERVRQIVKGITLPRKPSLESKVMLTVGEAALLLGLHENTVRRWSQKGILKAYRLGTRSDRRFRRQDVEDLLKETEA